MTDYNKILPSDDMEPIISVPVQGISWGLLNQRHSEYDENKLYKLKLLLKGGFDIVKKEHAKLFLKQLRAESVNAYQDRLSFATYQNNFGEIVNDFGSTVFSKPLFLLPACDKDNNQTPGGEPDPNSPHIQWQAHFTLDDQTMVDFLKDIQVESNALSCSYFGVDLEDGKPYAYHIDPCSVLDYQLDDEGNFIFIILRDDDCRRTSVRQLRNTITTTFTVWTRQQEKVECTKYQISYPKDQEPSEDKIVPKIKNDDEEPLTFKLIPIIECDTPDNLCIGNLIGELQASIFMRYSTFLFCLNRGLNPLLVYQQGAELPANGDLSIINEEEDRGELAISTAQTKGAVVTGPNDKVYYAGPDGKSYSIAQEQLDKDKNEMYRLVCQMASMVSHSGQSTSTKQPSGVSKIMDNKAKENMLTAYAKLVKGWAVKAFTIVFQALGQDVEWQPKGMDNYTVVDPDTLLNKIKLLPDYRANMPSKTSFKQVLLDVAAEMHPFTNPGTLSVIQEEIDAAIEGMEVGDEHVAQQANAENGAAVNGNQSGGSNNSGSSSASKSPASDSEGDQMALGPGGHPLLPEGSHLQTGTHISGQTVFDHLAADYEEKDIEWVKQIPWIGPVEVPLSDIDFSNKDNWQASKDMEHVQDFEDKVKDGLTKPIVLVNNKSNDNKHQIVDGHHRALAHLQLGTPIPAYIGEVSMDKGPWSRLHDQQVDSKQGSKQQSLQKSNQMNETSIQKGATRQVSKSEKAVGGKTK